MRVIVRTWSRQGRERTSIDRVVDSHIISVGRGTDQGIELADQRIALAQADIVRRGRFAMLIAKPGISVVVNGEPTQEHKLKNGDVIEIGRFWLQINPTPSGTIADFQVDVDEKVSAREERTQRLSRLRTSLADLKISRRFLAWTLFIVITLPTLALPAWLRFAPESGENLRASLPILATTGMQMWNAGDLSTAHASLKSECGKCHVKPFAKVDDAPCIACHLSAHSHVGDPHLAALPMFASIRCVDCHREHRGAEAQLIDRGNATCVACHAQLKEKAPEAKLEDVKGFSTQHPAFAWKAPHFDEKSRTFDWISGGDGSARTNLKFSHEQHLAAAGMRSPEGQKKLACGDCHVPDVQGVSFKPVEMQAHCSACHTLDFDPQDPKRLLDHAQPEKVVAEIRDYYAHQALAGGAKIVGAPNVVEATRGPGRELDALQSHAALQWSDQRASRVIDEVFRTRTCFVCHVVEESGDPKVPFRIAPVAPQRMPGVSATAVFSHALHRGETCASCHAAATSKLSSDVLMPEMKRCQDCHGDPGSGAKKPSICLDCHRYHPAEINGAAPATTPSPSAATTGALQ